MRSTPFLALCLLACSSGAEPPTPTPDKPEKPGKPSGDKTPTGERDPVDVGDVPSPPAQAIGASSRPRLQWKRYAAFEADLASALELPVEQLCTEFGGTSCVREVHLVPLGGHEPFSTGMFEPAAEPLATTPTVVERIVLSACSTRVELDRSEHKLFTFDLSQPAPAGDSTQVSELASALFRRFHARDPEPTEREVIAALTVDDAGKPVAADEFAKLACFVAGSVSEFLFF